MRVAFVTQIVPYPPHGGILQRGYNLLRELGREHHVDLIAFHHPDEIPPGKAVEESKAALRALCASVEYFPLWPKQSAAHKVAALLAAWPSPLPFSVVAQRSAGVRRRLAALCASATPPDVVHLDTIALAPYRAVCGTVPAVVTHHNIESQLMERRAEVESGMLARHYVALQARRLRRYEIEQSPRFPVNIMVSEADAAQLQALAPGVRTMVVPNGVDTEYFRPRPGEETPAVIYTGGMNMFANRDGVEWFLDHIWPAIKAAVPGVRFFAIGQRPSPRVLEAAAADPAVEAPGFVPDIRPWVARSAVYIVPLRVGGGTRLKMVDAMAQGKAIVATRVGAEGIAGDDGRHFVLADEPRAFADRVIGLLRDDDASRRLGAAAREQAVQVYAWPLVGRALAAAYAEAMERTARR
jgi:glycosyltransferase involved in cell wall biosynthesis